MVTGVEKAFKDRVIDDLFDERPTEFAAGTTFDLAAPLDGPPERMMAFGA